MALTLGSVNLDDLSNTLPRFQLRDNGYTPGRIEPNGDGSVQGYTEDVVKVMALASTSDSMATLLQSLDAEILSIARYRHDPQWSSPVLLTKQLPGESGSLAALARRVTVKQTSPVFSPPAPEGIEMLLGIERYVFERSSSRTFPNATSGAGPTYQYDYTVGHDIAGDVNARVALLEIKPGVSAHRLGKIWMGVRTATKHGTLANFETIWQCEDGTNNTGDESGIADTVDAGASGGTKVRVTPTDWNWDTTWGKVLDIALSDVTTDEEDNFGVFLWLLRCQVTAGDWLVQLRFGYEGLAESGYARGEVIELSNTDWSIFEQAIHSIPHRNLQVFPTSSLSDGYDAEFQIQIWAKRTSGSGLLDVDCLLPIPVDEGFFSTDDILLVCGMSDSDLLFLGAGPHDIPHAIEYTAIAPAGFDRNPAFTWENFSLPPGDGRIIVAWIQDAGNSDLTGTIEFADTGAGNSSVYYERWLSLRGGE